MMKKKNVSAVEKKKIKSNCKIIEGKNKISLEYFIEVPRKIFC